MIYDDDNYDVDNDNDVTEEEKIVVMMMMTILVIIMVAMHSRFEALSGHHPKGDHGSVYPDDV